MFCPKCGTQNPEDTLNCVSCGETLPQTVQIPNYLIMAILATVVSALLICGCCWSIPLCGFGIAAIVYAAQVDGKIQAGDIQGALAASKKAKMWSLISFGTSLLVIILTILCFGIIAFTGVLDK